MAMRPILKSEGPMRSASMSSVSSNDPKLTDEFSSPSGRRVTFSPFAKPRRKLQPKRLHQASVHKDKSPDVSSGFSFNVVAERDKRRQARRKHEMNVMRTLYNAAKKQRQGWRSILDAHLAMMTNARARVIRWARILRHPLDARLRRVRNHRIVRSRLRHALPVYFNIRDSQYVQTTNAPLMPPTSISLGHFQRPTAFPADTDEEHPPLVSPPVEDGCGHPMLIPAHQGSLSTLLRKGGIQATEDEREEQVAVNNDLRGITFRSTGLKIVSHHHALLNRQENPSH